MKNEIALHQSRSKTVFTPQDIEANAAISSQGSGYFRKASDQATTMDVDAAVSPSGHESRCKWASKHIKWAGNVDGVLTDYGGFDAFYKKLECMTYERKGLIEPDDMHRVSWRYVDVCVPGFGIRGCGYWFC